MKLHFAFLLAVVAALLVSARAARGATIYNVTDVGLASGYTSSIATGINSSGQIVGKLYVEVATTVENTNAFVYSQGVTTNLGLPGVNPGGSTNGWATGINAAGQVTGYFLTTTLPGYQPFIFNSADNTMRYLGKPAGASDAMGFAINDAGQVAGEVIANGAFYAALYSNGTWTDLGTLTGVGSSQAQSINGSGEIVGISSATTRSVIHGFLYRNGAMIDLGTFPGDNDSYAQAINASGQIAGFAYRPNGTFHTHFCILAERGMISVRCPVIRISRREPSTTTGPSSELHILDHLATISRGMRSSTLTG